LKSYKDLEIYQVAYKLAFEVHKMSLTLPKYELYEQGSQVRRSSKSIKDTIVEACLPARQGYGRKRYKDDFIRFLTYAQSSCDEAISQLEMISDIHFPDNPLTNLIDEYNILGKKINKFIEYVENNWLTRNKKTRNQKPETKS
jgi:four helix bundle protein